MVVRWPWPEHILVCFTSTLTPQKLWVWLQGEVYPLQCVKVCQDRQVFSPVSSINETDCYNITEILFNVVLRHTCSMIDK